MKPFTFTLLIFFLQLCVLKGCFQYNDAKPTDETPYKPGQPGAEWSSDEIDIVREKVGKARFFLETNFKNRSHVKLAFTALQLTCSLRHL